MAHNTTERGQALIMIALAAVVLFGFAALAIDGTMVFSDRRHAQNAADTAVLAAALSKTRGGDWEMVGLDRATSNGYNWQDPSKQVEMYLCSWPDANCEGLPTNAKPDEYIKIVIVSRVKTTFARILGRTEVTNRVEAISHVVPGYRTTVFGGNALVALNKTQCGAMEFSGSSTTTVTGSGIFVNSNCATGPNQAFSANTGSGTFNTPCMNVVGGITKGTNTQLYSPGTSCANKANDSSIQISDVTTAYTKLSPCGASAATYTSTTLNPGNYTGAFPPGGQTKMNPGVYCIDAGNQGFSLSGGQTLTGDSVLIYMKSGNVSWTSGGIQLTAIQGAGEYYDGLLLYLASGNCSNVSITGNGTSRYVGTILAPCSNVKLAGGSSTGNQNVLENQIIADTITLTGSNALNINFNAKQQWQPPVPPALELTK